MMSTFSIEYWIQYLHHPIYPSSLVAIYMLTLDLREIQTSSCNDGMEPWLF